MELTGFEYERLIVQTLVELAEQRGIKAAPLARTAWPEYVDGATKWRKIRNGDPPQELAVRDAHDLAKVMNISMVELCGLVAGKELNLAHTGSPTPDETPKTPRANFLEIPPARRGRQKKEAPNPASPTERLSLCK